MPVVRYDAPTNVLVAVKGHPFAREPLAAMFDAMEGVAATFVDQPAAARLMNPAGLEGYDALVLYDMPGLDFAAAAPPRYVAPSEGFKAGFHALLDQGCGVVALHHAIAGWPAWPAYADLLGGAFLYKLGTLRGAARADSGYRHDVTHTVQTIGDHPVLAGVPATFELTDELYLFETFEDDVTPLLRSEHAFTSANFYSAAHAVSGRMFSNEGWAHAHGSNLIGWAKRARNSPLVYLQPGDTPATYDHPIYRQLVQNAIAWVKSPQAKAWARERTEG